MTSLLSCVPSLLPHSYHQEHPQEPQRCALSRRQHPLLHVRDLRRRSVRVPNAQRRALRRAGCRALLRVTPRGVRHALAHERRRHGGEKEQARGGSQSCSSQSGGAGGSGGGSGGSSPSCRRVNKTKGGRPLHPTGFYGFFVFNTKHQTSTLFYHIIIFTCLPFPSLCVAATQAFVRALLLRAYPPYYARRRRDDVVHLFCFLMTKTYLMIHFFFVQR